MHAKNQVDSWILNDWEPFWPHQIKNFQTKFYIPSIYLSMQKEQAD